MSGIDISIVIVYFLVTVLAGLYNSRYIKNITDFAIADRNFATPIMVATLSATLVGGGSTLGMAERVFSIGFIYIIIFLGEPIAKLVMAYLIAPRMRPFAGMLTAGDMMESFYGKPGKLITGIAGTLLCAGYVGGQICAIGYFSEYFLHIPKLYGILLGCGIIIFYSSLGGIRAVTITDVIQFSVLIIALPLIYMIGVHVAGGYPSLFAAIPEGHTKLFPPGESPYKYIMIITVFCIPFLSPAMVQRLLMARNPKQIASSMKITAMIELPLYIIIGLTGFIALAINPKLPGNLALPYLVNTILPVGIKGLAIAGMLAVIMSTADSFLNAGSIAFVHDVIKPLRKQGLSNHAELHATRIATIAIGLLAIIASSNFENIIELVLNVLNLWGPIVVVPLYAGILGFKGSSIGFVLSALSGLATYLAWMIFDLENQLGFGSLFPAMITNGLMFYISCGLKPQSIKFIRESFNTL